MNYDRILVALGHSDGRDAAFERALALAKVSGAELYLLDAIPATQPLSYRAVERAQRAAASRARAQAAGISVDTVEQHGDPAEIILLHAGARAVDLILMGTERQTWWTRLREGSVAECVLRRTARPTLVVRGDGAGDDPTLEHVVVAVDMSPASTGLLDAAHRVPGGDNRALTIVHAVDAMDATAAVRNSARWIVSSGGDYVLDMSQRPAGVVAPATAGTDRVVVAAGPPAETIAACADDANADLVVMGLRRGATQLGSTALRALRHIDRPLLFVPLARSEQATDLDLSAFQSAA